MLIAQTSQASSGAPLVLSIPGVSGQSIHVCGFVASNFGVDQLLDSAPSVTITNCVNAKTAGATFTALFVYPEKGGGTPETQQRNRATIWMPGAGQQLHVTPGGATTVTFANGISSLIVGLFHAVQVYFRYV